MSRHSGNRKSTRKSDLSDAAFGRILGSKKPKTKTFESLTEKKFNNQLSMIEQGFYLRCPKTFTEFFDFCRSLQLENPLDALVDVDLHLKGPFEVLQFDSDRRVESGEWTNYYRYFHDPPEFVTLIVCPSGKYHLGYFRDSPEEEALFVAKSTPSTSGIIEYVAQNLFSAIESILKKNNSSAAKCLLKSLTEFTESYHISYDRSNRVFTERKKSCVCTTMNRIGLVVKLTNGDVGYRALPISYAQLNSELNAILHCNTEVSKQNRSCKIEELMTYVQFANDEGDYGEGLEFGLSLLAFHPNTESLLKASVFNRRIKHLLCVSYEIGKKAKFSTVVERHMTSRAIEPVTFSCEQKS